MLNYIEYLQNYISIPLGIIIVSICVFFAMQIIGEILEFKGKIVPEFMKIRKRIERKKRERQQAEETAVTLKEVSVLLNDVNSRYSDDNIRKRDSWINSVNKQQKESEEQLKEFGKKLDKNNDITLSLLIENKRNWMLSFASRAADDTSNITHEEYRRFFKVHREYEDILKENNMMNGEVNIAYRIVTESCEKRMKENNFVESIRGYDE